ncbi:MAG: hypothetical protein AAF628_27760 [Planctomycetota bacterium]
MNCPPAGRARYPGPTICSLVVGAFFGLASFCGAQQHGPVPVPSPTELEVARREVQTLYESRWDKLSDLDAAKHALRVARATFASSTGGSEAITYALLECSLKFAADGGAPGFAVRVVDALGARYRVDRVGVALACVKQATRAAEASDARRGGIRQLVRVGEEAILAGRDVEEEAAFKAARHWARALNDPYLMEAVDAVHVALAGIESDSSEATAHETLGRYFCVLGDDWDRGLKHLAQGSDEAAAELARSDMAEADEATAMIRVARGWWQFARQDGVPSREREAWRSRAVHWCEQAVDGLVGFDRDWAEARIAGASEVEKPRVARAPTRKRALSVPYGKELLENPSCDETPQSGRVPGWTAEAGKWRARGHEHKRDPRPSDGGYYFAPVGDNRFAQLRQDVSVAAYASAVDRGRLAVRIRGRVASFRQSPGDQGRLVLQFLDANDEAVGEGYATKFTYSPSWRKLSAQQLVPRGTRTLRVQLEAKQRGRSRGQRNNNAYFDAISLQLIRVR